MSAPLEILSREEAKARGLKRYFTGEPCIYGHVAERYVPNSQCFECARGQDRIRYTKNREKLLFYQYIYRESHREKILARQRAYRKANGEELRAKESAYRAAHRDKLRAKARANYAQNGEKIKAQQRIIRQRNRGKLNAKMRAERIHLKALREQGINTGEMP